MIDYTKLQNGSDIRGVASPGPNGEKVNLTSDAVYHIAKGFTAWLSAKCQKPASKLCVAIGHDSRLSADEIQIVFTDALLELNVKVYNCGLASTPAMFMSTLFEDMHCDGSVMITASHLPVNRNGFKFFTKDGGLEKQDIKDILAIAKSDQENGHSYSGIQNYFAKETKRNLMKKYSEHLRNIIKEAINHPNYDKPLEGLKVMVDAGNGAGGFFARDVLAPLGADVSSSQFLEPDGHFPNHIPNPEDKEAMKMACDQVKKTGADLGIILDTDVDRASAIDGKGNPIGRDSIVALAAALIAKEHPGTTVVTDSVTSDELTDYLTKCLGLEHLRFKRGYRNVINKSIELNAKGVDSQLAIETSGHAAYKENYFLDDGAYLATKIIIKAAQLKTFGENISALISSLGQPNEDMEKRFPIKREDFASYGTEILEDLKEWVYEKSKKSPELGMSLVEPTHEGVRIKFDNSKLKGWCLLRLSLHDPLMPLNIQTTKGSCQDVLHILKEFLQEYPDLVID